MLTDKQKEKVKIFASGSSIYVMNSPGADCYCFTFDDDGKEWSGAYEKAYNPRWLHNWEYIYYLKTRKFFKLN